ncbi:hypothetical protein CPB85DRAFT_1256857 [Mucidula mucida]|nr:hypothetical protein CPB85DRAFT_1256857 [Mucidula mucida]
MDIIYTPKMVHYADGTRYSKSQGVLVHRGWRVVCADNLKIMLLSFPLNPSLPLLHKKINKAFCNIPPEAIVVWHTKITGHLSISKSGAGGAGILVAATPSNTTDSVAVAPVEGATGPSRQAEDADAVVPLTGSSSCPSYDNVGTLHEPLPIDVEVLCGGDVTGSAALVGKGTPGLSSQAEGADICGIVTSKILPTDDIVDIIPPSQLSLTGVEVANVVSAGVIKDVAGLLNQVE